MIRYLLKELKRRDTELFLKISKIMTKGIKKDFNTYNQWIMSYKSDVKPFIDKAYNSYLKANKQEKGIASYSYVVDLLINYYKNK